MGISSILSPQCLFHLPHASTYHRVQETFRFTRFGKFEISADALTSFLNTLNGISSSTSTWNCSKIVCRLNLIQAECKLTAASRKLFAWETRKSFNQDPLIERTDVDSFDYTIWQILWMTFWSISSIKGITFGRMNMRKKLRSCSSG